MPSAQLFRTPEAIDDLDAVWDYIAQDSLQAADRFLDELEQHFRLLLKFPEMGEPQPLLADGTYRRSVYQNYVIYYRRVDSGIVLVRALHGARNHEQLL